jgi:hypothetical protein
MSESKRLEKAELRELDAKFEAEINKHRIAKVQFNPESMKVSFANQIAQGDGAGDKKGTPSRQFVGAGTTKLSLQLWFDVSAIPPGDDQIKDVRALTQKVAYFITPKPEGGKFIPPSVRFAWGSFTFDGLMDSLEESLEFFSSEGIPLRASVTLNISQQKITEFFKGDGKGLGTKPLIQASAGSTLQGLAASQGKGDSWQAIAAANNIENPRLLQPGQLINMAVSLPKVSVTAELPAPSGAVQLGGNLSFGG